MTAASTYLLRVRLPDLPGSLGQLASALGAAGADIASIVVVDRDAGVAVDDLLVGLPAGNLVDGLVTAACSVPGVVVESVQRHHGRMRVYDELALLDEASSSNAPLTVVVNGLPDLLNASYAFVAGGPEPVASVAAPPRAERLDWLPLTAARQVDPSEIWEDPRAAGPDCALFAAPLMSDGAIVLGRIGGPPFRPAELLRLTHLSNLVQVAVGRARVP